LAGALARVVFAAGLATLGASSLLLRQVRLRLRHAFEQFAQLGVLHRHGGFGVELAALARGFDQVGEEGAAVAHALLLSWDSGDNPAFDALWRRCNGRTRVNRDG
jgi:hypothetical protein